MSITIKAFFSSQLLELANNGYDVSVICSPDDTLSELLGDTVHYIPVDIPRGMSILGSIRAIHRLIRIFEQEKFDLIQYSTPNAALYASIAARISGCKVRNYHLMGFRYLGAKGFTRIILKALERITCRNSTDIECVSQSNLALGVKEGLFSQEKACVVWNGSSGGVDLERFDSCRRADWRTQIRGELGYSEDDFIFGFVGRITRDKGINELLQAFLELDDGSKLLLIGDLESPNYIDEALLQAARKSQRISFHSSVKDIERFYAAFDVIVLPSYREGFGNVIIEAAAVGTPAIVSDIPGPIDAVVPNKTALTIPPKNVHELLESMRKVQLLDLRQIGEDAASFVRERFDSIILNVRVLDRKKELFQMHNCNR